MRFKFPLILQKNSSEYGVIELEAQNLRLKDDLIDQLKSRIHDLEVLVEHYSKIHSNFNGEVSLSEAWEAAGYKIPKQKPRIRTMTEASLALEEISRRKIGEGKSAKSIDTDSD